MSDKIFLNARFGLRHDTANNWQNKNPILLKGEIGIVSDITDENWIKIGDGTTAWNSLPYKVGPKGNQGVKGDKGDKGDTGATGPQGIQGIKGDKGDKGDTGEQGPKGDTGEKGDKGDKGDSVITDQEYSPDSINAQSGIAVAQAISEQQKEYELVETIVTTEEVLKVERTQLPDGTPYDFERLQIYITVPQNTGTALGRLDLNDKVMCHLSGIHTTSWNAASSEVYSEIMRGFNGDPKVRNYFSQHTNSMGNTNNVQTSSAYLGSGVESINKISILSDIKSVLQFPIGTRFEIWAVRA